MEVNFQRPGHYEGFEGVDDFTKGPKILKKEKIKNFIMVYLNILGLHSGSAADLSINDVADNRDNKDSDDEWGASK